MATPSRGSGGGVKEKRGTSPSSSIIKTSPKPSSSSIPNSTSTDDKNSSTTDTSKPLPNYLKPTMSSSLGLSRVPKKSSTEASAQKPVLNRRRSFERPPPSAQVNRAIRGPPSLSQRSTSFSAKSATSSSTRPTSEKLFARASSMKDKKVGPHLSKSLNARKSTLSSNGGKEATSSSSSATKKPPKSMTSESSVDYESRSVDYLAIEDDFVMDDHEVQSLPEMSEMPESNKELGDPTNVEMEEVEYHEEEPKESIVEEDHHPHHEDKSTIVEQVLGEVAAEQQNEKADDHQTVEKADHQTVEKADNQILKEESTDDQQQVAAAEQNLVEGAVDEQDDTDEKVLEVNPVEPNETMVNEAKEEALEEPNEREVERKETEAKDEKLIEEIVSSPPADNLQADTAAATVKTQASADSPPADTVSEPVETQVSADSPPEDAAAAAPVKTQASADSRPVDTAAAPVKTQPSAAGKKDKQDYNDVIEQTATKLMGTSSRKNKVLALAGAFESVISLQDMKKS